MCGITIKAQDIATRQRSGAMLPHGCPAGEIGWLRSSDVMVKRMTRAIDPVCKMTVDRERATWKSVHNGEDYYFCAKGCKTAFDKDPERYL